MNRWIDTYMYYILILFAFASNISTAATSCAFVLGVLFMLIDGIRRKAWPELDRGILKIILFYGGIQVLAALHSFQPAVSFREIYAELYRILPLFFAMCYIKEKKQLRWIFIAFMFSVMLNSGYAMYQAFNGHPLDTPGFNVTRTFFSSHMLMALPVLYAMLRTDLLPRWAGRTAVGGFVLSFVMLFVCGTRGGWLAFTIVLAAFFFLAKRDRKPVLIGSVFACILFIAANIFISPLQARTDTITDNSFRSNSERIYMWEAALEITRDNPLLGVGQKGYSKMYNEKYISPLAVERETKPGNGHGNPHNNLLKVSSEQGLIGLAGYIVFFGYFFVRFYKLYKETDSLYALVALLLMVGIHMEGMTDWNTGQVPIMREFWFLLGTLFAAVEIERKTDKSENPACLAAKE